MTRKIIYVDTERGLTDANGVPLNEKQLQSLAIIALRGAQRLNAELELEKSLSPTQETPAEDICPTTGLLHQDERHCIYCHIGNL